MKIAAITISVTMLLLFMVSLLLNWSIDPLTNWLEGNLLSCPTKQITGIDCLGCGLQRSVIHLIQGEFTLAFKMYAPIFPIILTFLFLTIHLLLNKNWSRMALKIGYFASALAILTNYILKFF